MFENCYPNTLDTTVDFEVLDRKSMHESFHKDDPANYSRSWFAWANTLFGEFVIKIYNERPWILKSNFS